MKFRSTNWRKYLLEFLSIFIAVIAAFSLNNWNDNRRDRIAESKILSEIKNGLELDLNDIQGNMEGHQLGIRACEVFRDFVSEKPIAQDSLLFHYIVLVRDFTSIMNLTGYESLKSKGLEIIQNDSLRFSIITLYDYNYQILYKLEETVPEMQAFQSFYKDIKTVINPLLRFNQQGRLIGLDQPQKLIPKDRNILFEALLRIENNRRFKLYRYNQTLEEIKKLIKSIDSELSNRL